MSELKVTPNLGASSPAAASTISIDMLSTSTSAPQTPKDLLEQQPKKVFPPKIRLDDIGAPPPSFMSPKLKAVHTPAHRGSTVSANARMVARRVAGALEFTSEEASPAVQKESAEATTAMQVDNTSLSRAEESSEAAQSDGSTLEQKSEGMENSLTTSKLIVKPLLGDDMRRFKHDGCSFVKLKERLCKMFHVSDVVVRYRDDEDDLITITNEDEFADAVELCIENSIPLRLVLTTPTKKGLSDMSEASTPVSLPAPGTLIKEETLSTAAASPELCKQTTLPNLTSSAASISSIHSDSSMKSSHYRSAPLLVVPKEERRSRSRSRSPKRSLSPASPASLRNKSPSRRHSKSPSRRKSKELNPLAPPYFGPQGGLSAPSIMPPPSMKYPMSRFPKPANKLPGSSSSAMGYHSNRYQPFKQDSRFKRNASQSGKRDSARKAAREKKPPEPKRVKYVARFVKDVTVSDGATVTPNTTFVKTWRLRNDGETAWPIGSELAFVGNDKLGAPESVLVVTEDKPVPPNSEVDVSLELRAPAEPGRYMGYWRMRAPDGRKFGQRVWVTIRVIDRKDTDVAEQNPAWASKLKEIEEQGYSDQKKALQYLNKYEGDVAKVLRRLAKREQKRMMQPPKPRVTQF